MIAARRVARVLGPPLALFAFHALALRALFAASVVGRLLGVARTPPIAWLAAVAAFYVLRLITVFIAPGWLVLAVFDLVRETHRAQRNPGAPTIGP